MHSRGSRKHVLDWVESPSFPEQVGGLLAGTGCELRENVVWKPIGHETPDEAILDDWGQQIAPAMADWKELSRWWLVHRRGANRPNWDLVILCGIGGKPGLVLFEAKAHEQELERGGKRLDPNCSARSRENHERIGQAIEEARAAYARLDAATSISRDSHYQLSNRLAFSWKLADMGVPNILVYLGFTGDHGIRGAGRPFESGLDWESTAIGYISDVFPEALLDKPLSFGKATTRIVLRSRPAIDPSWAPSSDRL